MKRCWTIPCVGALALLAPVLPVLLGGEQGPPCAQPAANCQAYSVENAFNSTGDEFVTADDFRPGSSGGITSICFWGAYAPDPGGTPPVDDFTIRYYDDNGFGFPGTLIADFSGADLSVSGPVDTGDATDGGFAGIWEYSVTHPVVSVSSGGCYWVEITNPNDGSRDWYWAWANAGEGNGWSIVDGPGADGYDFLDIETGTDLAFCINLGLGDASTQCGPPETCNAGAGGCDQSHGPGCDDLACCARVCEVSEGFCCQALWDETCIGIAQDEGCFDPVPEACASQQNCQVTDLDFHGGGFQNAFIGAASDSAIPSAAAENFTPAVSGVMSSVCWWGFYFNLNQGQECSSGAVDDFTIRYYADDGSGIPGSVLATFSVTPTRTVNGGIGGGGSIPVYRYEASHADVAVTAGMCYWIEITNSLDGQCWWWWSTAPPGDRYSMLDDGTGYDVADGENHDLAWCGNLPLGDQTPCAAPLPMESCPAGDTELTQSTDPDTITPDNSIACNNTQGGNPVWNLDSYYARSYDLSAIPDTAGTQVAVECVQFGIEINRGGASPVTISLYEDTDGGAPTAPGDDLLLLQSVEVVVPASLSEGAFLIAEFDPPVDLAIDSVLVVEQYQPSRSPNIDGDSGIMQPGTNDLGQSAPTYFRAPGNPPTGCGINNYATFDSLNFFGVHLVQRVVLQGGGDPCPWDCSGDGDGQVGINEFLAVLGQWGTPGSCDYDGGGVGITDFLKVLGVWGTCP